jgi:thiamine biosynthesis lipoprotein
MHRAKAGLALTSLLGLLLLQACQRDPLFSQTFLQFGTLIEVSLVTQDRSLAFDAFDAIGNLLEQRHFDWHGWLEGDLSRFNRDLQKNSNKGIEVPATLQRLITDSRTYYQLSGGRFNPALGKLIAAWGFHQESQTDPQLIAEIQQTIPGMDDLVLQDGRAFSHNPYLQLDFGGIAKGLAIEQISALLRQKNLKNFIINAGGDVFTHGSKSGQPWRIALENPFQPGVVASIELRGEQAVFTSGNYRRFFQDDGQPLRHHIIDPLTGAPSTNISSATVVTDDPVQADAAATALMLTSPTQVAQVAQRMGIDKFLIITGNHDAYCSPRLQQQLLWQTDHGLNIHLSSAAKLGINTGDRKPLLAE